MRLHLGHFAILLLLSACGSSSHRQSGVLQGEHPPGLVISAENDPSLGTEHFVYAHLMFDNHGGGWERIRGVTVDFEGKEQDLGAGLVVGRDLEAWSESMGQTIVPSTGPESPLVAVSLQSLVEANATLSKATEQERATFLPEGHLYRPFSVPPGLISNRWLVLQKKADEALEDVALEVTYQNGNKVRYRLALGNPSESEKKEDESATTSQRQRMRERARKN